MATTEKTRTSTATVTMAQPKQQEKKVSTPKVLGALGVLAGFAGLLAVVGSSQTQEDNPNVVDIGEGITMRVVPGPFTSVTGSAEHLWLEFSHKDDAQNGDPPGRICIAINKFSCLDGGTPLIIHEDISDDQAFIFTQQVRSADTLRKSLFTILDKNFDNVNIERAMQAVERVLLEKHKHALALGEPKEVNVADYNWANRKVFAHENYFVEVETLRGTSPDSYGFTLTPYSRTGYCLEPTTTLTLTDNKGSVTFHGTNKGLGVDSSVTVNTMTTFRSLLRSSAVNPSIYDFMIKYIDSRIKLPEVTPTSNMPLEDLIKHLTEEAAKMRLSLDTPKVIKQPTTVANGPNPLHWN